MNNYQKNTLTYYEKHADRFVKDTLEADMSVCYERFEKMLPEKAYILDLGCGSGRDAKHFVKEGYRVTAVDGSPSLCERASVLLRQEVECLLFENLEYEAEFDGVWACASLLHVNKREIDGIIKKVCRALKAGGVFFSCFKYGEGEGVKDGRFFNNYTEESVKEIVGPDNGFLTKDIFISGDVREGRKEECWINVIGIKRG